MTVSRSRVTAAILAAPLAVDPNNAGQFMAIGRQALLLALVFIGGITRSLLYSAIEPGVGSRLFSRHAAATPRAGRRQGA